MWDRDVYIEIFKTIAKNKLRTFLAGFTVALGIFIFTVLFGMGNGLKNTFRDFFSDDLQNTLIITPEYTSKAYKGYKKDRKIELTNADYTAVVTAFSSLLTHSTSSIFKMVEARYKNQSGSYSVKAGNTSYAYLEKATITQGRFMSPLDIKNKEKVVVIGRLVALDLFGVKNPVGKYLTLNNSNYKVIGVFSDAGGDREERYIYMPYTTIQLLYKNTDVIDQIMLAYTPTIGAFGAYKLSKDIQGVLQERHSIHPEDDTAIYIQNIIEDLNRNLQLARVLQAVVLCIGIGTLLAGAIGISNIMVYVVKERTKELGIRKALGATPKSIIQLILIEAIAITLFFGYIGLLLGNFALKSMGDTLEDWFITNPNVDTATIIGATLILVFSGSLAGYIPARRAARIKPIAALTDS